jgi:peptide/nickel transport system permease protein
VFTIWVVLSGIFLLFVGGKKWHLSSIIALDAFVAKRSGTSTSSDELEETAQEYLAARGLDGPMDELYIDWMVNMFTLQWGESFQSGHDALPTVLSSAGRTAAYVVPAVVLAAVLGLLIGVLTAMASESRGNGTVRSLTYAGMGLPNFWIGSMLLIVASGTAIVFTPVNLVGLSGFPRIETQQLPVLYEYVLPFVLVATTLLGGIVSYTRAYAMQYYADDLTKHVRAKGGGKLAVARHVLRNAAVPLVSLLFAETLALIALSVFVVEAVFAIDGIGTLFYNAVWRQDLPILMGATMVISFGVVGNITQDVLHSILDPRVGTDSL